MIRVLVRSLAVLLLAAAPLAAQESAEPATPEDISDKRIGFYFGVTLNKLSFADPAEHVADVADAPGQPGFPVNVTGPQVDVDFRSRLNLEFFVGFRLRKKGSIEARFHQWDEKEDLFQDAEAGKAFFNSLASPLAGFDEDIDASGDVNGIEAGLSSEIGVEPNDPVLDGAEDVNFTGNPPEFLRFETSPRLVGEASADYQVFDIDYRRSFVDRKRFQLDWRAGLRLASLDQTYDVGYQQPGSFAVFVDEEGEAPVTTQNCASNPFGSVAQPRQDGDGDGFDSATNVDIDGDGFLDGNCNGTISDRIESVETLNEDRVVTRISTKGYGLKAGLDARVNLTKKWRLVGSAVVAALDTTAEHSYRETFTSERDRYLNFIDWDLNGDGRYDIFDLDFDGSCADERPQDCRIASADQTFIGGFGGQVAINYRQGIENSVVGNPTGLNPNAFRSASIGVLRRGDPVPESERNRDVLRETKLLHDVSGETSGIKPAVDLQLGLEWQFSRFANLGFGLRSSRWFDAGSFREIADDVAAGRESVADGDFTLTGGYVTLTIVPR